MRTSWFSSFVYQRSAHRRILYALPISTNPCGRCQKHRPRGQVKLTNMIVGKRKVSSRKRKKVEYRRTESDPRKTQASFCLQDFKMWKCTVLLLLALPPSVNKETPTPRMCAVCLEKVCATGVGIIYPAGSDTTVWVKANSPTGIQNCSMENLKPDAPCKMTNDSLVQLANKMLDFEGEDTYGVRRAFNSRISPCADLNLPFKPSLVTKAPIHDTSNPAAPNDSVADNKGIIIGSVIGIIIFISIGVLIWMLLNCGNEDRTVSPDGNAAQIQPLNAEVPNGNVNGVHCEDDSIGTAGLLGHCDDSPV